MLQRLREELAGEVGHDQSEATPDDEEIVSRALRHLEPSDLHSTTIDLALEPANSRDLPEGYEERSRRRVKEAVAEMRSRQQPRIGDMLHEARRHAGLTEAAAADDIGTTRSVLKRMEAGGVALLLNQAPERVADYVSRLHLDPKRVLSALFAELRPTPGHPRAVYGYTPGLELAERQRALQEAADSGGRHYEIEWAVAFLIRAERITSSGN